jgi:hypothetical protein
MRFRKLDAASAVVFTAHFAIVPVSKSSTNTTLLSPLTATTMLVTAPHALEPTR